MLFFALFLSLAYAFTPTQWFLQANLSDTHTNYLISKDCFRGTFGFLSLFTCPPQRIHIEPFAEVSSGARLCVIESKSHNDVVRITSLSREVNILFDDGKYLVVASVSDRDVYPQICSRSAFDGAAVAVFTVSTYPVKYSNFNVLAGKEHQKLDPIADFISLVTPAELEAIDNDLALGSPRGAWVTRNSYNLTARFLDWLIKEQLDPLSVLADVSTFNFRTDMYSNVIAEIPGTTYPDEIIFLGAHLDSRTVNNTSPTDVAPGADDNGSGSAVALLFARLLQRTGLRPARTIRIGWFSGEEQGLLGSRALAQYYRNTAAANIQAMFNVDMIGWFPTTPGYQTTIAFMIRSASLELTNSCRQIISVYTNTPTGETTGCCSDQQSFYENGFASVGIFETPSGNEGYPHYHRSTDLPQYVNFTQVALFAQGIFSCVLTAAL